MEDMEHAVAAFQQEHKALGEKIAIQRDRLDNARRSEQDTIIEKPLLAAPERDYTNKLGSTQHPRSLEAPREKNAASGRRGGRRRPHSKASTA